jgi:hypothetical protein
MGSGSASAGALPTRASCTLRAIGTHMRQPHERVQVVVRHHELRLREELIVPHAHLLARRAGRRGAGASAAACSGGLIALFSMSRAVSSTQCV